MKRTFRLSMAWLHTWVGLLLGWVLFAIFVTGTATYFKWEITRWMQPEITGVVAPLDAARVALLRLERVAGESPRWLIELPDARTAATTLYWQAPGPRRFSSEVIDPATGESTGVRETRGGEFFYRFHFQLQLPHPWGRYLAGLAAMFMMVALVSGIFTHRQFFKECFTFRPGRNPFRSFLDAHNVTAVLALPFYLMIAYSALVIFGSMYMPWAKRVLQQSEPTAGAPRVEARPGTPPLSTHASMPMDKILAAVDRTWGTEGRSAKRVEVTGRTGASPKIVFTRAPARKVGIGEREELRFDASTGEPLQTEAAPAGPAEQLHNAIYGLHLARFAHVPLRWMFFVMGVMGTALIGTGLVLWTVKRRGKAVMPGKPGWGQAVVERLNVATIAGIFVAIGAFFWGNRLLPVGLADRGDTEVHLFLGVWGVALVHAGVRPVLAAWREQLWAAAALLASIPFVDALSGPFLRQALVSGNGAYLGFLATVVTLGLLLACAATRVPRQWARPAKPQPATLRILEGASP
jgi:uncharacterized iron-regulated membrane protein